MINFILLMRGEVVEHCFSWKFVRKIVSSKLKGENAGSSTQSWYWARMKSLDGEPKIFILNGFNFLEVSFAC